LSIATPVLDKKAAKNKSVGESRNVQKKVSLKKHETKWVRQSYITNSSIAISDQQQVLFRERMPRGERMPMPTSYSQSNLVSLD
jgi:hypothetical protein